MVSSAAHRRVCSPLGEFAARVTQVVALVFLLASTSSAAGLGNPPEATSSHTVVFSAQASSQAPPAQPPSAPLQSVIDRIEFIGNRRIRTDTLKARIFSREGDPYNEETLRRDFQALWNTQFFEDVKLRVEDSPKRSDAKIILFEIKERPVIRRIRYDGMHSVSESDILDRFKERKVPLSVESQFDPTKIKRAEVVIKELLSEHGRQFSTIRTEVRPIPPAAVSITFAIKEGPKVKVGKITFTGVTHVKPRV